ncbi:hypothetical protein ABPG74_004091 [Tetrahymena malaccensis]
MFDSLKNKISGGKDKEKEKESQQENGSQKERLDSNETTEPKKTSMFDGLSKEYQKAMDSVKENKYVKQATEVAERADNFVSSAIREKKNKLELWMKKQMEKKMIEFLLKFKPKVANSIKDPDMPEFVKQGIDVAVDETYPIILDEVKYQFRMKMFKPKKTIKEPQVSCICLPCYKIKAWYNYNTNPVDMTIWKRMRTFSYWLLTLISLIPFYGIQQALYFFAFLCMDTGDEFMLVSYILDYKKAQFIGQGVIAAFTLYLSQFQCMRLWDDNSEKDPIYDCIYGTPSSPMLDFYLDLADFASQIVLIWLAFLLLPCSESKGKADFDQLDQQQKAKQLQQALDQQDKDEQKSEEQAHQEDIENSIHKLEQEEKEKMLQKEAEQKQKSCCDCSKGGKLYIFMIYDFLAFGVACLAFYYSYSTKVPAQFHQTSVQFAVAKLVYGYLSLPFLIFKIGQLQTILTKARPTAYDVYGNTVPTSKIEIDYENRNDDDMIDLDMAVDLEKIDKEDKKK